jgi:hypothetical protein
MNPLGAVEVPLWALLLAPVGWVVMAWLSTRFWSRAAARGQYDAYAQRLALVAAPTFVDGVVQALEDKANGALGGLVGSTTRQKKAVDRAIGQAILDGSPAMKFLRDFEETRGIVREIEKYPEVADYAAQRVEQALGPFLQKFKAGVAAAGAPTNGHPVAVQDWK